MGTQRYISTSFWDDPWIRKLNPDERYMYLYLITNTLTNIAGVYETSLDRICYDTSYQMDKIKQVLSVFEKAGKAFFYKEYIILPKWPKHQKWESSARIKSGIEAILKKLPPDLLTFLKKIGYTYPIDTLCIPYVYPSSYLDSDIDNNTDLNSNTDSDKDLNLSEKETPTEQAPLDPIPTANAVDTGKKQEKALVPSHSPPARGRKKQELTPEQLILYHAAKACFETSDRAKALMYQDDASTARELAHLKTLAIRCTNMAPGITAVFLKNVLEHFKVLTNGKLKGKAFFTPQSLITPWIWTAVICSLPENNVSDELREEIKGLFI